VSTETISLEGIRVQKCELRNVRVAVGMCLRNISTSTPVTLRNEYSNVFLYISYRATFGSACYQTIPFVMHDVAVCGLRLQTSMRGFPVKWHNLKFSLFAQLW